MSHLIATSMLSADFTNLETDIKMVNNSNADWFHLDVMDGQFVPNISFGMPVIKAMNKVTTKTMDCHLMIVEPEKYIKDFKDCGADILTVHYEACDHLHKVMQAIKEESMKVGVALNPKTPVSVLKNLIQDIDLVCLMSVNPGFGGQKFIEHTYSKTKELKELINNSGSECQIEIDGGVNTDNAKMLVEAGADVLVAGSFVFSSSDPMKTIADLKSFS